MLFWAAIAAWIVSEKDATAMKSAKQWTTRMAMASLALRDRLCREFEVQVTRAKAKRAGAEFLETLRACGSLEPLSRDVLRLAKVCVGLADVDDDAKGMIRVGQLIAPRLTRTEARTDAGLSVLRFWLWGHRWDAQLSQEPVPTAEAACRAFALAKELFGPLENNAETRNSCLSAERAAIGAIRPRLAAGQGSEALRSWIKEEKEE